MTGSPGNTFAFMPTRELVLLIDPVCLPLLQKSAQLQTLRLVTDLQRIDPPITVHLLLPTDLTDPTLIPLADKITPPLSWTSKINPPPFKLVLPDEDSQHLLTESNESKRSRDLLALADAIQADGIVTNEKILIDARYPLYQHHRARIVPLTDLADIAEIFCHGHSIFWSASMAERYITFDVFYQWTHWKNARLAKWFAEFGEKVNLDDLRESLRSALLNRYPFLLFSRDMIRFYELQMDFYTRRGLQRRFMMGVGFYVTSFYLLLWGMLDHLTIIAKWARDLKIDEKYCGIRSKSFLAEFEIKEPNLVRFLEQPQISDWIARMADMRHAAAHRTLALPAPVLAETQESKKDNDEILKIIKRERSFMYQVLPEHIMTSMEPMMISLWRISKMKELAPSAVLIKGTKDTYLWDPVISIDHDLQYVTAVMDAFWVTLFK